MPQIDTKLTFADHLGTWKARWDIGRMNYIVPPGLYAVGEPTPADPVLVTANYKMSYDSVRKVLTGRNVWLLVLETYGINVWCAAGKGTFSTEELVRRIGLSKLSRVVTHRQLILPLLGAPGVAAHEVKKQTGFSVRYAVIRAGDIPEYMQQHGDKSKNAGADFHTPGTCCSHSCRICTFAEIDNNYYDDSIYYNNGLKGFLPGLMIACAYLGAVFGGVAITPLLLPWLPGRSFAFKGSQIGLVWTVAIYLCFGK